MAQDVAGETSVRFFYTIAVGLFVYGWLSVNIYLPVLPQLEGVFQTTPIAARLTVTIFLIGFACTQLIWGPLSDRFGRKPLLVAGLAVSVAGALLAAVSDNIYLFAAARFLESLGLGVGPVLARSVLTDSLDRDQVAAAMSYVAIVVAIVPAVAPIVGGYIDLLLTWRGIFVFLAVYGTTLVIVCRLSLPETNRHPNRGLEASQVIAEIREILGNRHYVGYVAAYGIAFGTLVGYYAAAPFIFVGELGFSAHAYGYLLILNVAFYVLGATLSRMAVAKLGTDRPIVFALLAYALASVIFVVLGLLPSVSLGTASVLLPMCVFIFGTGLVSPAANAGAMTIFRDKAGTATAMVGFSIAIGGAVFSGALSAVHITRLYELGAYVAVATLATLAVYMAFLRHRGADDPARQ